MKGSSRYDKAQPLGHFVGSIDRKGSRNVPAQTLALAIRRTMAVDLLAVLFAPITGLLFLRDVLPVCRFV
jgi:hypothetical protein